MNLKSFNKNFPNEELLLREKTQTILKAGEISLVSGTGSYRVKQVMHRVALALGIKDSSHVTLTEINLNCWTDLHSCTMVKDTKKIGVNGVRIAAMDRLARDLKYKKESANLEHIKKRIEEISKMDPPFPMIINALSAGVACGGFAFILGAGIFEVIFAIFGGFMGQLTRKYLVEKKHLNQFIVGIFSTLVAGFMYISIAYILSFFFKNSVVFFDEHSGSYIFAMLFIIPGFPLITGGLDIVKLNFSSGISRLVYSLSILVCAMFACAILKYLVVVSPTTITEENYSSISSIIFILIASFFGVMGFALMFNLPFSVAIQSALVGCVFNTLRLVCIYKFHFDSIAITCVACIFVGLVAKPLCERNDFAIPRIVLTVPATVIMIPGSSFYKLSYFFELSNVPAIKSIFLETFFIILAIPLGLAIARFMTDKRWRKN